MQSLRTFLRYLTIVLLVIAILTLLATVILWFLAETGRLQLRGLEPINVFIGFIVSALLWVLSKQAEKRIDVQSPPQPLQSVTINGNDNLVSQGSGNVNATSQGVAAGGNIGAVTYNIDNGRRAAEAEQTYLQRLAAFCDTLPLDALGNEAGKTKEATLSDVFIDLDTDRFEEDTDSPEHQSAVGRLINRQPRIEREEKRPISARAAATQTPRMVLLGDPGSGKSSCVRHWVGTLARAKMGDAAPPVGWKPLFPLLTVLRDLAPRLEQLELQGKSDAQRTRLLADAVEAQWQADIANYGGAGLQLENYLKQGKVLLVFDGLDEVPHHTRRLVRLAITAVLQRWEAIERVIVTCRIRSYEGSTRLTDFDDFTLAPLDQPKIDQFVQSWYAIQDKLNRLAPTPTVEQRITALQQATRRTDLRSMAENPMLLTTMTLVHQQETELPGQRVVLYRQAVDVLMRRWQKQGKGYQPNPELDAILRDQFRIRPILEAIAWEAHHLQSDRDKPTDLERGKLYTLLERPEYLGSGALAETFLDYIDKRSGLLIGLGGDDEEQRKPAIYTFPHRTFQEYLAGCYLTRDARKSLRHIRSHAKEGDFWYLAVQYGTEELLYGQDGRERPHFLDIAYQLCPATEPETSTDLRTIVWSGYMATAIGRAGIERDAADEDCTDRAYLSRLLPKLQVAMTSPQLTPVERAEAGRHLAQLGDPRTAVLDVDALSLCYVPAGMFTMGNDNTDDDEKPRHDVDLPYDYWIGQLPITNAQFGQFVAAGGYRERRYWQEAEAESFWQDGKIKGWRDNEPRDEPMNLGEPYTLPNHPAVGITWYEMLAFTRWLTDHWQQIGYLPKTWGVHLPSEAEWEKAARGGHKIPATAADAVYSITQLNGAGQPNLPLTDNRSPARRWTWATTPQQEEINPNLCNYADTQIGSPNAVGIFPQMGNPYGCQELLGNVDEWTRSLWQPYGEHGYQLADGRENLAAGSSTGRVFRGSGYGDSNKNTRCGVRGGGYPDGWANGIGFRVVVSPLTSDL